MDISEKKISKVQLLTELAEARQRIAELERIQAECAHFEEELLNRAAELEAVFSAQNDAVLIYDTNRNVLRVNHSFIETYGFDPVGLNIKDIVNRVSCRWLDGRAFILEEQPTPRALRGEKVAGAYFLVKRSDGTDMVVETSSGPMRLGDCITGSVTVWHDITEMTRAEDFLRKSEASFKMLSETAGRLLESDDPQAMVNELCMRVMEHLDCQAFFNFLADDQSGRLRLNASAGIPEEKAREIEWLDYGVAVCGCAAQEGSRIIAEDIANAADPRTELVKSYGIQAYCCHPLLAQGRVIGTLSFGTRTRPHFSSDEIAIMKTVADQVAIAMQRIQTKDALSESEMRYRSLVETSPDGIIVHREGYFLYANSVALKLYGAKTLRQLQTKTVLDLIHPDDRAEVETRMQQVQHEHRIPLRETKMVSLDGRITQVETVGSMIDFLGEPAVQIIIRDITGRKRSEEELKQAHELLEAITKGTEVIIAAVDTNFRYTYFNATYQEEIKRLTGKDIRIGTSMIELFAHMPEQQKTAVESWRRILDGESVNKTIEFGNPDRHRRLYIVIQTPLRDAKGTVVGAGEVAYDVTKQRQIEKELDISLTKYKVLFNSFPLGISITDKVGNIIESSHEAERLLGISQEELENRAITGHEWRIIRPDGSDMPEDEYASVIALKNNCLVENVEMGIVKGGGDITWMNVTAAPIPLEEYGVAITYGDISNRKRDEEALRKSEQRFHDLFSSMSEGFALHEIICDDNGKPCDYRFIDVNPAFEQLTGLKREDVVGKTVLQVLPDEDLKWIKVYGSVALTGEPVHFENYSPVLNRHYEAFSYRPAPDQFAVIFMDITQRKLSEEELYKHRDKLEELVKDRTIELEARNKQLIAEISQRKKAENALRLASAYNRSLIEASLDPLMTIDVNGRITDVNKATEKVTGRSRRELINTDFYDYFTEQDKARAGYKLVFSEGKVQDYPLNILHCDGHITPVLYNASLYHDQEGRALGVFAAARDITERMRAEEEKKRLEGQLIQAQKIEALGKLAGGIAHDFNNVLQPILINSELISDILSHGTQEREYLDQIIDAAHLGKNLIRQIKLFGSRKGSFHKPITMGPVVQDALNLLKRSIPSRISFRQWITQREGLVRVDPIQIHQLILNLCNNAVQAMNSGKGFLGVSLKEIEIVSYTPALISDIKPGKYLKLTVRDTGAGISQDIRDKIFDPFFTTKKSSKGTGLGLAVVHELIKNANGSILLKSAAGKGAKFEVYFPEYIDPQDQAHRQLRQSQGHGEKHILLADDNAADLRSIHQLLIHLGYQVTSTSDPQEALKIFRDEPKMFSLVITDQVMPRMKGHELAGHIHQIRQDIPVILCSGSEEIMQELQEKNADINEFILKPFSRSQLQDAIGRLLA